MMFFKTTLWGDESGKLIKQGWGVEDEAAENVTADNSFEKFVNRKERAWVVAKRECEV